MQVHFVVIRPPGAPPAAPGPVPPQASSWNATAPVHRQSRIDKRVGVGNDGMPVLGLSPKLDDRRSGAGPSDRRTSCTQIMQLKKMSGR